MAAQTFTITPSGPFSLRRAATFGFGQRDDRDWDGVMRLAFCLDGYTAHVGVEVRQDDSGVVHGTLRQPASQRDVRAADLGCAGEAGHDAAADFDLATVERQVARVLSLDHDGQEFTRVGEVDPVIGRLQQVAPGLRPPLFYSPYEAAAWAVLSARRPARQMMAVRQRFSEAHGPSFDLAGQVVAAFPAPQDLLRVSSFPGITAEKLGRLHGVARAALDGQLDAASLIALGPDAAMAHVRQIKGIGPFYSSLIMIRGTGFADVLPVAEPKALSLTARLYNEPEPLAMARFHALAEAWKPLRTWAIVLIRAAGPGLLASDAEQPPEPGEFAAPPEMARAAG